ncbi:hypothetical protein B5F79_09260 [Olsenella sp. An285]|uniref:hypothetical protein n=1 Tax=Olsenella sp. An285 TaxID=1965621 RepID=UPI000B372233|nr:hypothetical protein [Olsenella sp. An285]OUO45576.1 hypothetical protein B5F79_09260 [Olsenella sp. An285]
MKKGIAAAALVAVLALAGCAKTVEGSVETVVKECKEFPTDASVNLVITGRVDGDPYQSDDTDMTIVWLVDGDSTASCMFRDIDEDTLDDLHGRVTIEGKLDDVISDSLIYVDDCKLR